MFKSRVQRVVGEWTTVDRGGKVMETLVKMADDRGKGVPSFDEMVAIVLEEVEFDDPITNVRGRRALAIAKPTSEGY